VSEKKEFLLKCECGAKYIFQGSQEDLEKYLDSDTWMCEAGRHAELGEKRTYLSVVEERDELSEEPKIEPQTENEYTVAELQEEFGTTLEHIGFGMFKDPDGNIWDYRIGSDGNRLYSKR